eukprot:14075759-Alexandrium_andersonii.AAC.1
MHMRGRRNIDFLGASAHLGVRASGARDASRNDHRFLWAEADASAPPPATDCVALRALASSSARCLGLRRSWTAPSWVAAAP